jgi:hypothetical protein
LLGLRGCGAAAPALIAATNFSEEALKSGLHLMMPRSLIFAKRITNLLSLLL